ncbi:FAD/NAD(P)-binding protein [Nocardia sp. BMG51109]|uniref:FAD/NAD(P)-binding protein n=1 Tax=Nocardia sp. BMG51109 TaxID=1056816 RepID=UPI0004668D1B|nr:FAD/NAD(P)-binding protein [Nocardia sp. BMG51109]
MRYRLAIVGGGPRTTYALSDLLALIDCGLPADALTIEVFEAMGEFGAGRVYSAALPPYLEMNRLSDQIALYPQLRSLAPQNGDATGVPSVFHDWVERMTSQRLGAFFPPRRLHGLALRETFESVAALLRNRGVELALHRHSVETIDADGSHPIVCAAGQEFVADEVLLSVGHGLVDGRSYTAAWADAESAGTVVVRGQGLTALDAVLVLTEGRGGIFDDTDCFARTYRPSGREPRSIRLCGGRTHLDWPRPYHRAEHPFAGLTGLPAPRVDVLRDAPAEAAERISAWLAASVADVIAEVCALPYAARPIVEHNTTALVRRAVQVCGSLDDILDSQATQRARTVLGALAPWGIDPAPTLFASPQVLAAAVQGVPRDPVVTAVEFVLRERRDQLSALVQSLPPQHRVAVTERVLPSINSFVNGPSPRVYAKMLTLARAGRLEFGADSTAEQSDSHTVLEAYIPRAYLADTGTLLGRLAERGYVSTGIRLGAGQRREDRIAVDAAMRVVAGDGLRRNLFAVGAYVDDGALLQASALRPGTGHQVAREVRSWSQGFSRRITGYAQVTDLGLEGLSAIA